MKFDYVIVGAGYAGSVLAERIANVLKKKVLIIEQRNHIGGNAYDTHDKEGILIHKYGPHIFHTVEESVWNYLSNFTEWDIYHHEVLGVIDGKKVPIPFNLNTLHELLPGVLAENIEQKLVKRFGFGKKVTILELKKENDDDLKFLSDFVYNKVFLNYTIKQWGMKPEELAPSVTGRVPVFISRDNRYFQDQFQAMPRYGYTAMFRNILDSSNIKILLNTDYKEVIKDIKYEKLIFSGMIDYFFDYKFGQLPYRSLDFNFENLRQEYFQDCGTVNYPNDYKFTRITEFKRLTGQKAPSTTIVTEFSKAYVPGQEMPYYPIPRDENENQYLQYEAEAKKQENVMFVGRLAQYKYFNQDQTVLSALKHFDTMK